jgi:PhzF family phenazine biosynthesis protein
MGQSIIQVDAFSAEPFAGNPAAVCVLEQPRDERWMRQVAQEMNLSETAFLTPEGDGFRLRWFTPTVEVKLCGHATLASAHVLWETGRLAPEQQARFHTRSGLLTAERQGDWIELNLPATASEPADAPPELIRALGITPRSVSREPRHWLVEVESEQTVRELRPDFGLLKQAPLEGVIVTSRASSAGFDFVSRFFAPQIGIDEDPVTGAAHCTLGPFWQTRLGQDRFTAYQASARGGVLRVQMAGERVRLSGQAITVMRGELVERGR